MIEDVDFENVHNMEISIKPLMWSQPASRGPGVYQAETAFGTYRIVDQSKLLIDEPFLLELTNAKFLRFATLEAAKEAAQTDHDKRVQSVLAAASLSDGTIVQSNIQHAGLMVKVIPSELDPGELKRQLDEAREEVVFGFYEADHPLFAQGYSKGLHELSSPVTAEECSKYVKQIVELSQAKSRLEAALALGAWQPIETAPMDGTKVDLWARGRRWADARFLLAGEIIDWPRWQVVEERKGPAYLPLRGLDAPTHWMRSPTGPAEDDQQSAVPAQARTTAISGLDKSSASSKEDRGIQGQIMDAAWPKFGGNHQSAEFWNDFGEGVAFTVKTLNAAGFTISGVEPATEDLERRLAVAYQVVGVLAAGPDGESPLFDHPEIVKALDYFSMKKGVESPIPFSYPQFEISEDDQPSEAVDVDFTTKSSALVSDERVRAYKAAFKSYMDRFVAGEINPPTADVGHHATAAGLEAAFRAKDEPVAWQRLCPDGSCSDDFGQNPKWPAEWNRHGSDSRPLYAHPSPSIDALEEELADVQAELAETLADAQKHAVRGDELIKAEWETRKRANALVADKALLEEFIKGKDEALRQWQNSFGNALPGWIVDGRFFTDQKVVDHAFRSNPAANIIRIAWEEDSTGSRCRWVREANSTPVKGTRA